MSDTNLNTGYSENSDTGMSGTSTGSGPMSGVESGANSEQLSQAKPKKKNTNLLLIGAVFALLVLGGGFFFLNQKSQVVVQQPINPLPAAAEPAEATPVPSADPLAVTPTVEAPATLTVAPSDPLSAAVPTPTPVETTSAVIAPAPTSIIAEPSNLQNNSDLNSRVDALERKYTDLDNRVSRLESLVNKEVGNLRERVPVAMKKAQSNGKRVAQRTVKKNQETIKIPQVLSNNVMKPSEVVMAPVVAPILPPPPVTLPPLILPRSEPVAREEVNQIVIYDRQRSNVVEETVVGGDLIVDKKSGRNNPVKLSSGDLGVQAIIPGRAWLKDQDGVGVSYVVGDTLNDGRTVVSIDPDAGTVALSDGIVLN